MNLHFRGILTILVALSGQACGSDEADSKGVGGASGSGGGNGQGGATAAEGGKGDFGGVTSGGGGSSAASGGSSTGGVSHRPGTQDTHGFTIYPPETHQIDCGEAGTLPVADADWLCTFTHGATAGYVYVLATPTGCTLSPSFAVQVAQISVEGQVTALADANYDWGGNHHNDSISFVFRGNAYSYSHSSFGYGWRACQNMDCLQVSVGATGSWTEDGCTDARSIPVVCSEIQADGTYADLASDTFSWCPGDPNHA